MAYNAENAIHILQGRLQSHTPHLFVQAEIMVRQIQVVMNLNFIIFRCTSSWPGHCSAREGTLKHQKRLPKSQN